MQIGKETVEGLPIVKARSMWLDPELHMRPSVEHTGYGTQLFYTAFGGRWFRSSLDWVREGIDQALHDYLEKEQYINCNTFYSYWGVCESDFGYAYGYTPDEKYRIENLEINIEYVDDPTSSLVSTMGEPVYVITPSEPPCEYYMEC